MRKYISFQGNDYDCGFQSLKMLLATITKNGDYLKLPKGDKRASFTFQDLIELADSEGCTLKAYHYDAKEELELDILEKYPILVNLNNGINFLNHLVLVTKFKNNRVYFTDPKRGEMYLDFDTFIDYFTGDTLEVEDATNLLARSKSFKISSKPYLPLWKMLLKQLISLSAFALLIIGFMFIREDEFVALPLIFIILFSLTELVGNWYTINLLKQFDEKYFYTYFTDDIGGLRYKDYEAYVKFKEAYLKKDSSMVTCGALAALTISVMLYNSLTYIVPIAVVIALALLDYFLDKVISPTRKEIEYDEEFALLDKQKEDASENLEAVSKASYKYASNVSLKKTIYTLIFLIMGLMLMFYNKLVSLNYILFNLAMFYFLFENIQNLLTYDDKVLDYEKKRARFDEIIECNTRENVL